MSSEWIIGALAFLTIGLVLALSIYHFGTFLKDPRNRGTAKNALINDGKSATTKVRDEAGAGDHAEQPLKVRLDQSEASAHPADALPSLYSACSVPVVIAIWAVIAPPPTRHLRWSGGRSVRVPFRTARSLSAS